MRVSPNELQAVDRGGMLTRFAMLGPVAYVHVTLPGHGTSGTGLDEPCLTEHHGLVSRGTFSVIHEDGRREDFGPGTAFYVPAGPPTHSFLATPNTVVGGFAPVVAEADTSDAGLASLGFSSVHPTTGPTEPPRDIQLAGLVAPFRRRGSIDVEGSRMGDWVFMRARFGPRGGFTSGWCDLPHWGMVLDGEIAITYEDRTELAARGDVYFSPPGHRLLSPDGATVIDYTPVDSLGTSRISAWRRAASARAELPVERALVAERAAGVADRVLARGPLRLTFRPA